MLQQQVETPLIPQLFTGKLSREEIEETLARLLESTKHLIPTPDEESPIKVKEEPVSEDESDIEMEGVEPTMAEGAEPSHGLKTQPGIKTDDIPSSTDLKKMTSKERRQLRNKISARNFRVRRKGEWTVIDVGESLLLSVLWIYLSIFWKKGEGGTRGRLSACLTSTQGETNQRQRKARQPALSQGDCHGAVQKLLPPLIFLTLPVSSLLVGPLWMVQNY